MAHLDAAALDDIQGIILNGYAHLRYGTLYFLQVRDAAKARRWLGEVATQTTTSKRWAVGPDGKTIKPPTTVNVALTHPGAQALQLPGQALATFSPEFREGIVANAPILGDTGDSDPAHWDVGGPENPEVHVLLILFARDRATLERHAREQEDLVEESRGGVVVVAQEQGARPRSQKEPFGFRDGVSNPLIEGTPGNPVADQWVVKTGEFLLGYLNEYGIYPLSPSVLASDDPDGILAPFPKDTYPAYRDLGRNGSYLVYRKLEQDVEGFWRYVGEQHAEGSEVDSEAAVKTASKLLGRWPSGAPLVLSPDRDDPALRKENRFTYALDPHGFACPAGAHTRRANPRAALAHNTPVQSFTSANTHRLLRRAMSYGGEDGFDVEHGFDVDGLEEGRMPVGYTDPRPRGIHFLAVNADIRRQFELVQQNWCNNRAFNAVFDNKDAVMGDNDCTDGMTIPRDPLRRRLLAVPRFVTTRGGGYCFLPSITALRYMADVG